MTQTYVTPLEVADVSGDRRLRLRRTRTDALIGDVTRLARERLSLPGTDPDGRALVYQALLTREGRHLFDSERVGDVLNSNDLLVLQPNIDAGAPLA
jgi:hypothetical protein